MPPRSCEVRLRAESDMSAHLPNRLNDSTANHCIRTNAYTCNARGLIHMSKLFMCGGLSHTSMSGANCNDARFVTQRSAV